MTTANTTGSDAAESTVRFLRVGEVGQEVPVIQDGSGRAYDLSPVIGTGDLDGAFFGGDGVSLATQALARGELPERSIEGLRVGPPVARPRAVICIGQNYAAHAAETGSPAPKSPIIFFKHPNTVVGPFDDVVIPRGSTRTDWEVELAVVIGFSLPVPGVRRRCAEPHCRLHHFQRCFRTRISNRALGWAVVQRQELRDLQPVGPIVGPERRGPACPEITFALLCQR